MLFRRLLGLAREEEAAPPTTEEAEAVGSQASLALDAASPEWEECRRVVVEHLADCRNRRTGETTEVRPPVENGAGH